MPVPYLGGELKKGETEKKGRFDYAAWAVICNKLNSENERWQPGIRFNPDGLPYHICGNTAAVLIYFKEYETGKETPDWFYPITNNQNKPIPLDQITCWDVNNAHKRGLCSAAAGFFSLGYELWAKEELADMEVETSPPVNNDLITTPKQKKEQPLNSDVIPEALSKSERMALINEITKYATSEVKKDQNTFNNLEAYCRKNFPIPDDGKFSDYIQEKRHAVIINDFLRPYRK
ncbi:MAG: hypothetical protein CL557_17540 [Alphaproteobacteria bacterium]|nr:hypothetical protein [Alphaproteobacteria bacterium]